MRQYNESEEVDAVVIGTGAGGAPLLARLAAAGRSVVALEAGNWWEAPEDDFATDELDAAKLYWQEERLAAGDGPAAYGGNNSGTGVGGSTLHWGAFVPRADPRDLAMHTEFGVGADWPLSAAELQPYYEEVERFLGVSGPDPYPWDPGRRYPTGPVPVNGPGQLMQRGFSALGWRSSEAPIAALSTPYARPEYAARNACVNRGFCHQGCRNGAKATMDVTFLPWAVRSGAEIRPNSFACGVERNAEGRITAVLYQDASEENSKTASQADSQTDSGPAVFPLRRQRCRAVVLCAGAIESARFLLHTGVANSNGIVGKHFTSHVATQVWGTFPEPVRMNKGFPATVISEDMLRPKGAEFAGGYIVQSLGVVPVTWANSVARGRGLFGKALLDHLDQYNFMAGIGINGDCAPYSSNYLELSEEPDRYGVPKPLIHFSYGRHEKAMDRHATQALTAAWLAAGARDCWTLQRSAHTIGTCRMGHNPETAVVDPFGRSHEIQNLWISDNSVFPSALAANPALTIMALSLRTADALLKCF